jgi:hypothetical protein
MRAENEIAVRSVLQSPDRPANSGSRMSGAPVWRESSPNRHVTDLIFVFTLHGKREFTHRFVMYAIL